jgi:hypothetical protein
MKASIFTTITDAVSQAKDLETRFPNLEVNVLVRERPGDQVSKLVLGLHNAVRTGKLKSNDDLTQLLDRISKTTCVFGFVFKSDQSFQEPVLVELHKQLQGILLVEGDDKIYSI